ncbi:MAG: GIY-YIG nuclease family protein [Pseudomonadota bacterium]|nr:GIY-YIG nuclease family protein [Pseudomonadota bacterium]|tara:strand:- start:6 stop:263 length:258 start_codon:yes stop_codon:yes gene_type:complete
MTEKTWYLYVLQCSDGSYYTGVTTDIKRRLNEHNNSNRGAKYTRTRRPVKLIYFSEYDTRSSAQKAEHTFKKLSRKRKEMLTNER